jgi:hypothetical protein
MFRSVAVVSRGTAAGGCLAGGLLDEGIGWRRGRREGWRCSLNLPCFVNFFVNNHR